MTGCGSFFAERFLEDAVKLPEVYGTGTENDKIGKWRKNPEPVPDIGWEKAAFLLPSGKWRRHPE